MAEQSTVWVVTDGVEPLDRELVELLARELDGSVRVEARRRPAEPTEGGMAERLLRSVISDELPRAGLSGLLMEAEPAPEVLASAWPTDLRIAAEVARRGGPRPVLIGLVREPVMSVSWRSAPADILLVIDEHASESAGERRDQTRVTGVPVDGRFEPAGDSPAARKAAGLAPDAHVVLITAEAFAAGELEHLLVQLRLVRADLELIFEVREASVADRLRRLVPLHGLAASLLPADGEGAEHWALAHLIIAPPRSLELARARAVRVPLLAAPPRDETEREVSSALVDSGAGRAVESLSTVAVDLDLTFEPQRYEALAERVAALAVDSPADRTAAVVREALERGAAIAGAGAGLPTGLERIGDGHEEAPSASTRFEEAARAATEVRDRSETWRQRAEVARRHGDQELALEADKRAARHHEVLHRLLESLRPEGWEGRRDEPELEQELEELRHHVLPDENVERRLRNLEVEDELRALKERLEHE